MVDHWWSTTHRLPLLNYQTWVLVLPTQSKSMLWMELMRQGSPTHSLQTPVRHTSNLRRKHAGVYSVKFSLVFPLTEPAVVKDLTIEEVTTSSVSLTWTRPDGNASSYIVEWNQEGKSHNNTTNETSISITGLSPGFQYKITVSAVSGDLNNKGQGNSLTTSTSRSIFWRLF